MEDVVQVKNSFIEKLNTDFEVRSLDSVCINTSELKLHLLLWLWKTKAGLK